ncbi:MAG: CDP-diacylglycerol--glycerol-3-phosphate 3-phosphatidyltransferase [Alphaproteobacteria bacterium MarineAlpha5_Bin11]|nr:MAG: CDP-diacylglycerol--glycerol-3-phosphate 3-phosphatidyltransferase [Alphaproteobacteria bacterium MarineAlpha5_Bin11]PPR51963.1 MAG: CDP-diacylglycerol--glycerol-3-phosphate 3-phosphatidyltransferase [Alphaproteobacteria bacterium MarineAlpha5_Bin10]
MTYNLSNILTLSRIAIIPIILLMIIMQGSLTSWIGFALFVIAGITDFMDGYLARIRKEQTTFGTFLDPIADKLLVASVILVLTAKGIIGGWTTIPALIILMREILVSGLREFLSSVSVSVPVSRVAKFKTTLQIFALAILILSEGNIQDLPILFIGEISLWVAAALTLYTGSDYLTSGIKHLK